MIAEPAFDNRATRRGSSRRDPRAALYQSLLGIGVVASLPAALFAVGTASLVRALAEGKSIWVALLTMAVGGAALAGVWRLRSATLRNHAARRAADENSVFERTQEHVAFDQRLEKFLDEVPPTASGTNVAEHSRMPFFAAAPPGARRGPRSATFFREILWRIHRLLRGR